MIMEYSYIIVDNNSYKMYICVWLLWYYYIGFIFIFWGSLFNIFLRILIFFYVDRFNKLRIIIRKFFLVKF